MPRAPRDGSRREIVNHKLRPHLGSHRTQSRRGIDGEGVACVAIAEARNVDFERTMNHIHFPAIVRARGNVVHGEHATGEANKACRCGVRMRLEPPLDGADVARRARRAPNVTDGARLEIDHLQGRDDAALCGFVHAAVEKRKVHRPLQSDTRARCDLRQPCRRGFAGARYGCRGRGTQ